MIVHKKTKELYLEEDGRDWAITRGGYTGMPTHYRTLCGIITPYAPGRKWDAKNPPEVHFRWATINCSTCLSLKRQTKT